MTTDKNALLPCPFCGCDNPTHTTRSGFHYGDKGYSPKVEQFCCIRCNATMNVRGNEITKEQAIEKWNTRAPMKGTDNG